ncbi:MAG: bestrophin family protein [Sphingobacteriaceae bacterium]|nr:bestrophin family protein [Cytophagaceae bacterium]
MIVRPDLDPKIVIKYTWRRIVSLLVVAAAVAYIHEYLGFEQVGVDTTLSTVLGTALAILLGFRVTSAYDRWWEARRLWGAITNDSRTMARQLTTFLWYKRREKDGQHREEQDSYVRRMVYRQIGFTYALKNHLRRLEIFEELRPFVGEAELAWLRSQRHVPNALLQKQAQCLQEIEEKGYLGDFRHVQMETRLSLLCDSMGGCERIKNTVFPRQYSVFSTGFVTVYSYLLPFVLVGKIGWVTIPATLVIGFLFYALDSIAKGIENPFENRFDDTPMSSICRTIEINLRQQLGETELPEPVALVNGFLF